MKTVINFVENNANATTFAKNSPRRGLERILSASGEQKRVLQWCEVRLRDIDVGSRKKPAGCSFHVMVMEDPSRTECVGMANAEKMLAKVQAFLGEVSKPVCSSEGGTK